MVSEGNIQKKGAMLASRQRCTACFACVDACPFDAIEVATDKHGFTYPSIIEEKCRQCGCCARVCPEISDVKAAEAESGQEYYGFKHKSDEVRRNSSSGGVFTWLSDIVLQKGGVIYGAAFDNDFHVIHKRAETKEERDEFRGSKYVQSETRGIYRKVRKDLDIGKFVLFSGLPCQCAALKAYLGSDKCRAEKLVTLDFLCEGCPNDKIWMEYKAWIEERHTGKISALKFRDKETYKYDQDTLPIVARRLIYKINRPHTGTEWIYDWRLNRRYHDPFFSGYLQRESCLDCKYRNYTRYADYTCGDFHRYSREPVDFKDSLGISELLVNTEKAKRILRDHSDNINLLPCSKEDVWQPMLGKNRVDMKRRLFWWLYDNLGYKVASAIIIPKYNYIYGKRELTRLAKKFFMGIKT